MYWGCGRATPSSTSGTRSAAWTSASKLAQSAAMSPPSVAWAAAFFSLLWSSTSFMASPAMNSSFTEKRTSD